MRKAALLLFAPLLLSAQEAPGTVAGKVIDSVTGLALKGAELYLVPGSVPGAQPNALHTATDDEGRFSITCAPGGYGLRVTHEGFADTWYGAPAPLRLAAGEKKEVTVPLVPHAVITGRVEDASGKPVAGVQVRVRWIVYRQGRKRAMEVGGQPLVTGAKGEYRVTGLLAGKYFLSAEYPNRDESTSKDPNPEGEEAYVETYYPSTPYFESAAALDVSPGTELPDIVIRLAKAHTVCVRVRTRGTPQPGAKYLVLLARQNNTSAPEVMYTTRPVQAEWNYEARHVLPGSYVVSVLGIGGAGVIRQPVEIGRRGIQEVTVQLMPAADVSGQIRVEGDVEIKLDGIGVRLRPADPGGVAPPSEIVSAASGALQWKGVGPDRYLVEAYHLPPGCYVKSIRSGGADIAASGIEIAGGSPAPLDILLSPNGGTISGTALDADGERPVSGVVVALIPRDEAHKHWEAFYRVTISSATGGFTFAGLAPGEYTAIAFADIEYGAWLDTELMAPLLSKGETVEVREKSGNNIQLKSIRMH